MSPAAIPVKPPTHLPFVSSERERDEGGVGGEGCLRLLSSLVNGYVAPHLAATKIYLQVPGSVDKGKLQTGTMGHGSWGTLPLCWHVESPDQRPKENAST